ncbi:hypothetical protein DPMN_143771 [Dreissena polymorpha]|uniref:Uncharacterized protein n=1 Tax=Dreissena polymorpha TaxID=45954 RepID=A0A9D4GGX5_DREPO|nr:hypothetical protein DPMN_143771 [Dreissena polymorpha]
MTVDLFAPISSCYQWSKENEAGSCESREDIRQILKYRKSLSCPKCDKQINFDFYYWQHLEWCGREVWFTAAQIGEAMSYRNL